MAKCKQNVRNRLLLMRIIAMDKTSLFTKGLTTAIL